MATSLRNSLLKAFAAVFVFTGTAHAAFPITAAVMQGGYALLSSGTVAGNWNVATINNSPYPPTGTVGKGPGIILISSVTVPSAGSVTLLFSSYTILASYGYQGLISNESAANPHQDTFYGYGAGNAVQNGAKDDTYIGSSAGASTIGGANGTGVGTDNTAVGVNSLLDLTYGGYDTAIGSSNMGLMTLANYNTCVGVSCMGAATGGTDNIGIGVNPLTSIIANSFGNVAVGDGDFFSLTGSSNTAVGYHAGANVGQAGGGLNSYDDTFIGFQAGYDAYSSTGVTLIGAFDPGIAIPFPLSNASGLGWNAIPRASSTTQLGGQLGSGYETMVYGSSFTADSQYVGHNYSSNSSNPAASGIFRLANADQLNWRNANNTADLGITLNASNQFVFLGGININPVSNQLVLGGAGGVNFLTITAPTPAASQTYTVPDISSAGWFVISPAATQILPATYMGSQGKVTAFNSTNTFTTPATSSTNTVYGYILIAPGGGGGGTNGALAPGGGGGAGGMCVGTFTGVAASSAILVDVSTTVAGGNATGTNGVNGGSVILTTAGTVIANGGRGGTGSTSAAGTNTAGGAGGICTNATTLDLTGATGNEGYSVATIVLGGQGASESIYGTGGIPGGPGNGPGGNATNYGAGGGGASGAAAAGGSGGNGLVVITQLTP
jgi:hypothetical protein